MSAVFQAMCQRKHGQGAVSSRPGGRVACARSLDVLHLKCDVRERECESLSVWSALRWQPAAYTQGP